ADVNRVAEQLRDRIDVAARPGDFNRMANGALDTGRRRLEFLRNGRVQRLRDGAEDFDIAVYHRNCLAQVLIPFDMSGNPDFMNDVRNAGVEILALVHRHDIDLRRSRSSHRSRVADKLANAVDQYFHIERLQYIVGSTQ